MNEVSESRHNAHKPLSKTVLSGFVLGVGAVDGGVVTERLTARRFRFRLRWFGRTRCAV